MFLIPAYSSICSWAVRLVKRISCFGREGRESMRKGEKIRKKKEKEGKRRKRKKEKEGKGKKNLRANTHHRPNLRHLSANRMAKDKGISA
jgi:hypothetical protein